MKSNTTRITSIATYLNQIAQLDRSLGKHVSDAALQAELASGLVILESQLQYLTEPAEWRNPETVVARCLQTLDLGRDWLLDSSQRLEQENAGVAWQLRLLARGADDLIGHLASSSYGAHSQDDLPQLFI